MIRPPPPKVADENNGRYLLAILVLTFPTILWEGFVLSHLWNWFIAESFNLPMIYAFQMAGIAGFYNLFVMRLRYPQPPAKVCFQYLVAQNLIGIPLILLFGYLLHLWMS